MRVNTHVGAGRLATLCGVSNQRVHAWEREGKIPGSFRTPGGHLRVPVAAAVSFLERLGVAVPDDMRSPQPEPVRAVG